jgi:hypothetical protein
MLQVHFSKKSSKLIVFLPFDIGLLPQKAYFSFRLFEFAEEKS